MTDKTKKTEKSETKAEKPKKRSNFGGAALERVKQDAIKNYQRHLRREEEELEDKLAEQGKTIDEFYEELDRPRPRLDVLRKKLGKKG